MATMDYEQENGRYDSMYNLGSPSCIPRLVFLYTAVRRRTHS